MHLAYPAVLAVLLFCVGLYGVLARRNAILVLMAVELMLNAVNINLVAFDVWLRDTLHAGQAHSPSSPSRSPRPRSASGWRSSCSSTATAAAPTSTDSGISARATARQRAGGGGPREEKSPAPATDNDAESGSDRQVQSPAAGRRHA